MGEALITRRMGSKKTEGLYAWKKSEIVPMEQDVTFSGSGTFGNFANPVYLDVVSNYDKSYFTDELFINLVISGNGLTVTLLPNKKIKFVIDGVDKSNQYGKDEWQYEADNGRLRIKPPQLTLATYDVSFSGSGKALQPEFSFLNFVIDDEATKYPDDGQQGDFYYKKVAR